MTGGSYYHYHKGPATPADVARYGDAAAAIRAAMDKNNLTVPALSKRLGMAATNSSVYLWVAAKGSPGSKYRKKLAEALGIPIAALVPKGGVDAVGHSKGARAAAKPGAALERPAPAPRPPTVPARRPAFSFTVAEDGEARIQFDVSMPVEQAWPLVRLLADHGLIRAQLAENG